jgi:hypothetical protein
MLPLSRTAIKTIVKDSYLYVSFRIHTTTTPLPCDSQLVAIIKPTWIKEGYTTNLIRDKKHVTSKDIVIPAPKGGIPPNATIDIFSNGVIVSTTDLCLTNDEEIWRYNAPELLTGLVIKTKGVSHIEFKDVAWKCPENFQPTNNTYIAISCPKSVNMSLSDVILTEGVLIPLKVLALEYPSSKRRKFVLSVYEGDILLASVMIQVSIPQYDDDKYAPNTLSTSAMRQSLKKRKITHELVFDIPNKLQYVIADNKSACLCMFKLLCPEGYVPIHAELVIDCFWNDQTIHRALVLRDGWLRFMPIKFDNVDTLQTYNVRVIIKQSGEIAFEKTSMLCNIASNNSNLSSVLYGALEELIYVYSNE